MFCQVNSGHILYSRYLLVIEARKKSIRYLVKFMPPVVSNKNEYLSSCGDNINFHFGMTWSYFNFGICSVKAYFNSDATWQVTHQYTVSCLLKLHRIVCKIKRWKLFDPFMDLHRSYTNVNVTWVKDRIQKLMGVWELENQIEFSKKYFVNSHINAALEQPKTPPKMHPNRSPICLKSVFGRGGFAPPPWSPYQGFALDPLGA